MADRFVVCSALSASSPRADLRPYTHALLTAVANAAAALPLQYTGQWTNDGREGLGVYRSSPAELTGPYEEKYDGWWRSDKMHGQGKYYWSNGDVYDGMWKEDKRHGQGVLVCASGDRYEGGWKGDARHGKGTFVRSDVRKLVGRWKNSQFVGDGR